MYAWRLSRLLLPVVLGTVPGTIRAGNVVWMTPAPLLFSPRGASHLVHFGPASTSEALPLRKPCIRQDGRDAFALRHFAVRGSAISKLRVSRAFRPGLSAFSLAFASGLSRPGLCACSGPIRAGPILDPPGLLGPSGSPSWPAGPSFGPLSGSWPFGARFSGLNSDCTDSLLGPFLALRFL